MAVTVTHTTVATGTDAGNGEIRKAEWNEAHTLTGTVPVANGGTDAATALLATRNLQTPYVIAQSGTPLTVGAVTTEVVLSTVTIPGGAMGPNGMLRITSAWEVNNSANDKWPIIRVGGTGGALYLDTTMPNVVHMIRMNYVVNLNSQSSQSSLFSGFSMDSYRGSSSADVTSSVNTASDWDLVFAGRKPTSAADTCILMAYTVEVFYGA